MNKILVVEDDQMIRDVYQAEFEQAGYQVDIAINGEEGIKKIIRNAQQL